MRRKLALLQAMVTGMHAELEQLSRRYQEELAGLTAQFTQLHPKGDPQRWSVQQIIEHLLLTYESTNHALERRIAKGTVTSVRPTLFQRFARTALFTVGRMPAGRRAPQATLPITGTLPELSGFELGIQMRDRLAVMDGLIESCEARMGRVPLQNHMVLGPLTARQWRRFHVIHGNHHLRHIRCIKNVNTNNVESSI